MSENSATSAEVDPSGSTAGADPPAGEEAASKADPARAQRVEALREALELEADQTLERAYLFEPLERRDVAFRLALVVKRIGPERLEMIAIGARAIGTELPVSDFVRRASFPEAVLPSILEEFIDRCGVEGAFYRELPLAGARSAEGEAVDAFTALADALYPT